MAGAVRTQGGRIVGIVLLAYAVMSLADGLGVLSERMGFAAVSSVLFFLGFAFVPVPVGVLCARWGAARVLRTVFLVSAVSCVCLAVGGVCTSVAAAGFVLAGLSNVALQVSLPALVGERFSSVHLAGIVTGGLFVKTAAAVAFPFAVSALAGCGHWSLALLPFFTLSVVLWCVLKGPSCGGGAVKKSGTAMLSAVRNVLKDPVVCCSVLVFAIAIVADVVFNLAVPGIVSRRFGGGGDAVGVVYAVWFGVKLPLMLVGSRLFLRYDARRFFAGAVLVALVGAGMMAVCEGWWTYLVGVGLFAVGFANVYGHVFGAAAPRHPSETSAVSSLLVMAISAGALASPILTVFGAGVVPVLVAILLPFAVFLSCFRSKV